MNYKDFLTAAEDAYSTGSKTEAGYRSAIHLSYYAAFHACCDALRTVHKNPAMEFDHAEVRKGAKDHKLSDKKLWAAARHLTSLWYLRVRADYHLDKSVTKFEADQAIENANLIVYA